MGVFGFVYFVMPNNGCEAIIFFLAPRDIHYGSQAALIAESFTARLPTAAPRLAIGSHPSSPKTRRR
jgi:hypothetical protein